VAREKSREDKLFAAAVLRRSFELSGDEHRQGFRFVYEGVLRDLGLADEEVADYLRANAPAVEEALGRHRP
jgi:hypothetical protein